MKGNHPSMLPEVSNTGKLLKQVHSPGWTLVVGEIKRSDRRHDKPRCEERQRAEFWERMESSRYFLGQHMSSKGHKKMDRLPLDITKDRTGPVAGNHSSDITFVAIKA